VSEGKQWAVSTWDPSVAVVRSHNWRFSVTKMGMEKHAVVSRDIRWRGLIIPHPPGLTRDYEEPEPLAEVASYQGELQLPLNRASSHTSTSTRVRTQKLLLTLRHLLVDPLKITLLLRHPPILYTAYFSRLAFGFLYVLNISLQDVFAKPPYNFSVDKIGLAYISSGFGFLLSAMFGGKWADTIMAREARRKNRYDETAKLLLRPEDRIMENAWFVAIEFPLSVLWYGWSADKGVFWVVPVRPSPLL
jgi:hypothetical protein